MGYGYTSRAGAISRDDSMESFLFEKYQSAILAGIAQRRAEGDTYQKQIGDDESDLRAAMLGAHVHARSPAILEIARRSTSGPSQKLINFGLMFESG